jgi:salicylate hydroxylase
VVRLFERAPLFSEVGAGIQISPNVVRVLRPGDWKPAAGGGLERLQVRAAVSGATLATLSLGGRAERLYGAPYATIHRADLHQLLLESVRACSGVALHLAAPVQAVQAGPEGVVLETDQRKPVEGDVLVGADGLWARCASSFGTMARRASTGHLAFRAMLVGAAAGAAQPVRHRLAGAAPCGGLPGARRRAGRTSWPSCTVRSKAI